MPPTTVGALGVDSQQQAGAINEVDSLGAVIPLTSAGATATTISTIAIRAEPHSTVVVALLKSTGFTELRIDEMSPGLLEIGSNPQRNAQLLAIHEDLVQRLAGKRQQVEELLGRAAKQLVQEQKEPNDVLVYQAMADGLTNAWKGLGRQLEMRGFVLKDTQRFYEQAQKHEELAILAESRMSARERRQSEGEQRKKEEEVRKIVEELAQLTREGLENGANVIGLIRLLGSLADNADRPKETFEACLAVEKVMLRMAQSWEGVDRTWRTLREQLQSGNEIDREGHFYTSHLEAAEKWLCAAQQRFERIIGGKMETEGEREELAILGAQIKANQVGGLAEQIYAQSGNLPVEVSTRCAKLLEKYSGLLGSVELAQKSVRLLTDADSLLTQMDKMRAELAQANAAMAGELGPLAQQKGVALIDQGEALVIQWEAEGRTTAPIKEQVAGTVSRLKETVIGVVQLARDRISEGRGAKLRDKLAVLERWLHSSALPLLGQRITLGPNTALAGEFLPTHRRFAVELTGREQETQSLLLAAQQHQKMMDSEEGRRLQRLQKGMADARALLETRLQMGTKLEQLQKMGRELETTVHFLATLLQQNPTEDSRRQMRHLLQRLSEQVVQERHQGDLLFVLADNVQDEQHLKLDEGVERVHTQLDTHQTQLADMRKQCRLWEERKEGKYKILEGVEGEGAWPPEFVQPLPAQLRVQEGQRLTLSARLKGNLEPEVTWLRDGTRLAERMGHCRLGWLNEQATLTLEEVLAEDGGQYTLCARNQFGSVESRTRLSVQARQPILPTLGQKTGLQQQSQQVRAFDGDQLGQEAVEHHGSKPSFVRQLESVSVREGDQFKLDCVVVGCPEPKVIWFREEQTITESDRLRLGFHGDHCTLSCARASAEDAGLYKVLATNIHGESVNFCRVCIVPPSPKRKPGPPTMPKPLLTRTNELSKQITNYSSWQGQQEEEQNMVQPVPPSVQPQLCSQVVREGQPVIFQVLVSGSPLAEVRWTLNGQPIAEGRADILLSRDQDGHHTLSIPLVTMDHTGQYVVEASNPWGVASSSATLNVLLGLRTPIAGLMTDSPAQTDGETTGQQEAARMGGTTRQMAQQSGGEQSPAGQMAEANWRHVQQGSSSFGGPIFAVSRTREAESRRGSDLGDPGISSVANPPLFLRPFLAEVTVNEGERAEVDCIMLGNPRPKVQWLFNERPVRSSPDFVQFSNMGDTYSIIFSPARLDCAGYYRLIAENIRGRGESVALVHVRPKSMQRPMARRSIGGGGQGLLSQRQCQQLFQQQRALSTPPRPLFSLRTDLEGISTSPAASEPQFPHHFHPVAMRRQRPVPEVMSKSAYQPREQLLPQEEPPLGFNQMLMPGSMGQMDEGPAGQGSGLHEEAPPHFMQTLVSVVVAHGQQARFEAGVTGMPAPRLEWTKDGQPLEVSENIRFWTEGAKAILAVERAGTEDAGKYCCSAENPSGMASSSAQLVLRPRTMAPDFMDRLVSEEVEEGSDLRWTVRASGEPEPTVNWLRDGRPIGGRDRFRLVKDGPFLHSLLVQPVQMADAGQFTCVLENSAGEARSTADLVVRARGAPPGKYVHVTKVTQEKQVRADELAQTEIVTIEGQIAADDGDGSGEEEEEEEEQK